MRYETASECERQGVDRWCLVPAGGGVWCRQVVVFSAGRWWCLVPANGGV